MNQGSIQAIPPTLQQSLMARLDRLGPAREVAQIGSVIGRDFSYGLLRALADMEEAQLQSSPGKACRRRHPVSARATAQKPNTASSTRSFRMRLTRICSRAGVKFCTVALPRFCATNSQHALRLSRRYWRITSPKRLLTEAAIEWWGKAGDQALRRSAFQEAISHLGKAIEMADSDGGHRVACGSG